MATFKTVVGKNDHRCRNCGKTLPKGEKYLRVATPYGRPLVRAEQEYGTEDWLGAYCNDRCFAEKQAKRRW